MNMIISTRRIAGAARSRGPCLGPVAPVAVQPVYRLGARHGGCAGRAGSPRAVAPRAADWTTLGQPTTLYGVQFMLIVIDRRRHGRAVDVYIYRCYATRTVLFEIGIYIDLLYIMSRRRRRRRRQASKFIQLST